jgi:hypothetical protein
MRSYILPIVVLHSSCRPDRAGEESGRMAGEYAERVKVWTHESAREVEAIRAHIGALYDESLDYRGVDDTAESFALAYGPDRYDMDGTFREVEEATRFLKGALYRLGGNASQWARRVRGEE